MKVALIGAGARGYLLASLSRNYSKDVQIKAIAEPRADAMQRSAKEFGVAPQNQFSSWQELFKNPPDCDAAIIGTMDKEHRGPAEAALKLKWHLLLEKPMSDNLADCEAIEAAQRQSGATVAVCHSMRYHQAFAQAQAIASSGKLGKLMTLDLYEQVGFWHFAHSFVRGNWRKESESAFVLLAKSCHDMDLISWLAGDECISAQSFGSLSHFKADQAPKGATARCTDCPVTTCAFDARKLYQPQQPLWGFVNTRAETLGETMEAAQAAHINGPHGRCVYACDNDVADHQTVNLQFKNGLCATFTLSAFTYDNRRRLRMQGTEGELELIERSQGPRLRWRRFIDGQGEDIELKAEDGSHGGADARLVANWLDALTKNDPKLILSDAQASLKSHKIAFAAEASRKTNKITVL